MIITSEQKPMIIKRNFKDACPIYGFLLAESGQGWVFSPSILAVPKGESTHHTLMAMMTLRDKGITYTLEMKRDCEVYPGPT